jgi:hypothetical protein
MPTTAVSAAAIVALAIPESLVQFIRGFSLPATGPGMVSVAKSLVLPTVRVLRAVWLNLICT